MTAYAESPPSAALPETRTLSSGAVYAHGVRTGLLGAAAIALWFLFIDYYHGRPLYTPTLLGTLLLGGGGVLPPAIAFTIVHCAVFILIGIASARLEAMIEEGGMRHIGLGALLLFLLLDLAFCAFALSARAIGLEALSWPDVLIGNGIAAAVMIVYLLRRRPRPSAPPA